MKQSEVSRRLLPSPLHSLILWTEIWDYRKREGGEGAPAWRWQRAGWHPRGRPRTAGAPREGAEDQREQAQG